MNKSVKLLCRRISVGLALSVAIICLVAFIELPVEIRRAIVCALITVYVSYKFAKWGE